MSVAMLQMAASGGTTDIDYEFQPELIAERRAELQGLLGDGIRIHTGCDFHLKHDNILDALARPEKYSVNGLGWVLVEFSDMMIFPNTEHIFAKMRDAGMRVIVTHPERNWLLRGSFPTRCRRGAWYIFWRATRTIWTGGRRGWTKCGRMTPGATAKIMRWRRCIRIRALQPGMLDPVRRWFRFWR